MFDFLFLRKRMLRTLSALVVLVFVALMPFTATPFTAASDRITTDDVNALKSKLNSLSSKTEEYQNLLDSAKNDQTKKLQTIENYENLIASYYSYIETANLLTEEYNAQIAEKNAEIEKSQAEYDRKYAYFLERLRATYEEGEVSYLELIFSSGGFLQMLESLERAGDLLSYDTKVMEDLEQQTETLEKEKAALEELRVEQKKLAEEYQIRSDELAGNIADMEAELEELEANIDKYADSLAYYENAESKADSELDALLKAYHAQQKADQAAQDKNNNGSNGGGSTGKDTTGSTQTGDAIWPLPAAYQTVTSPFGYRYHPISGIYKMHNAADIYAPKNTKIYATMGGTVIIAKYNSSYGYYVVIDHGNGITTLYAHCNSLAVSAGQTVKQGAVVGYVGKTGSATGYHLHFEWRVDGTPVNPLGKVDRP